jgi:hypothetical protein
MNDVDGLRRIARRVPRYNAVLQGYRKNYEKMNESLAFWTPERERRFVRVMKMFEHDWLLVARLVERGVLNKPVKQLWRQLEILAHMLGSFAVAHERAIAMARQPVAIAHRMPDPPAHARLN